MKDEFLSCVNTYENSKTVVVCGIVKHYFWIRAIGIPKDSKKEWPVRICWWYNELELWKEASERYVDGDLRCLWFLNFKKHQEVIQGKSVGYIYVGENAGCFSKRLKQMPRTLLNRKSKSVVYEQWDLCSKYTWMMPVVKEGCFPTDTLKITLHLPEGFYCRHVLS